MITTILPLLTLLVGGRFVIDGEMTLGQITAFVEYSMNIVWPMEMLGWLTNSFFLRGGVQQKDKENI